MLFSDLSLLLRQNRRRRQSARLYLPRAHEETQQLTLLTPCVRTCIHCAVTYAGGSLADYSGIAIVVYLVTTVLFALRQSKRKR